MKKLFYLIVLIAILGLIVPGCLPVVPPAEQGEINSLTRGDTLIVGPGGPPKFATIQAAVDAASDDDTIIVGPGTYYENVDVWRSVRIISVDGAEDTIVDASGGNYGFWIKTNDVTIKGFTVTGADGAHSEFYAGIFMEKMSFSNIYIEENIVEDNDNSGIFFYLVVATDVFIRDNEVRNNGLIKSMPGIRVYSSKGVTIEENEISGNGLDGITIVVRSENITVSGNEIYKNSKGQTKSAGIFVANSDHNIIEGNEIKDNYNHGIRFANGADHNTISENEIKGNVLHGIWLHRPTPNTGNVIEENEVKDNGKDGIRIEDPSTGNTIRENEVSGSGTFDLYDNSDPLANIWEDNEYETSDPYPMP